MNNAVVFGNYLTEVVRKLANKEKLDLEVIRADVEKFADENGVLPLPIKEPK